MPASRLPILHKRMCKQEAKPQGTEEKESLQRSLKDFHLCFPSLLSPDEVTTIGWKMIHRQSILIDDSSGWPTKNFANKFISTRYASRNQKESFLWQVKRFLTDVCKRIIILILNTIIILVQQTVSFSRWLPGLVVFKVVAFWVVIF